jgi:1-acyl-sn-glycerol-3-phosphate acyltransferase
MPASLSIRDFMPVGTYIDRLWRRGRTGFSFAAFGLMAVWISAVALPMSRLWSGQAPDDLRAQRSIHRACQRYLRMAEALGLLRWTGRNLAALAGPGPHLVVANHPTLLDMVLLCALLPQVDCIVNAARASNPFLRGAIRMAGYVTNSDGPRAVEECVRRLRAGRNILLFPEGTRSPAGGLGRFRRGAAHIALRSGVPLIPVLIRCDPPTLGKGQSWYDVPEGRFELTVLGLDPIAPDAAFGGEISPPLAARRLTAQLFEAFDKNLEIPASATQALEIGDRGIA